VSDRQAFVLANPRVRENALAAVRDAADYSRVTVAQQQRSKDQNAYLHALLTDLARSPVRWAGKRRTQSEWKTLVVSGHSVATADTPEQARGEVVPGLEGEFVSIRESTADMSVARASSLIEYVLAFCVSNNVDLRETRDRGFLATEAA
jgi:hypothetical protein